jgi:hypothetical protein
MKHKNKCSILSMEQYGFRTKSTTNFTTYTLTNEILKTLKNRLIVVGIFCDLGEAFYCVPHDILRSELELCGIVGIDIIVIYLIKLYLIDRYHTALIYNKNRGYSTLSNWTN